MCASYNLRIKELDRQQCEAAVNEQIVRVETCKQYVKIQGIAKAPARYNADRYDGMYSKTAGEENGRPVYEHQYEDKFLSLWYDARAARHLPPTYEPNPNH